MNDKDRELEKKLGTMEKPSLHPEKKEAIHQLLMKVNNKYKRKKRSRSIMKRFVAGLTGVAAIVLLVFFIMTSSNEKPLDHTIEEPIPDETVTIENPETDKEQNEITDNEKDEISDQEKDVKKEPDKATSNPFEKYQVFSDYMLEHPGYLSEARTFYKIENTNYFLAYGHQAHAVNRYELFEVKDNTVTLIRSVVDDADFERIESIVHLDNWKELMIDYLLKEVKPTEEIFFSFDNPQSETEVTIEDQSYMLFPINVTKDKIYFFKEGEGLWVKLYKDEATINMYGEEQKAIRIQE
ncbi:hypothetical protein BKP45_06015 [Anaerobacillus alkalidiazotrophicus]|uniref:DUF4367 domain-containing protein n=1 Tax=Anaerobacillus alkalidiazotrophicus TaxID=472963 RepID=A0A1S2MBX0_9BACI|nr:hypothetical protein [Anaerobacillus alkalidiazotrophicus]OIJ22221.1 hypothetical protein BKP45_06015 [Anaerobacillus alkalidiazotrophicus]